MGRYLVFAYIMGEPQGGILDLDYVSDDYNDIVNYITTIPYDKEWHVWDTQTGEYLLDNNGKSDEPIFII